MRIFRYIMYVTLVLVSFYFSDRLLIYVESFSPIMKSIEEYDNFEEIEPVNSIIEDNTIIVGSKGKTINKRESYLKMNDFGTFNETFFVYDEIEPDVSLEDNMDKIIIGSQDDENISLIVDNKKYDEYFNKQNIKYTKIIKNYEEITEDENIEYINANSNSSNFYDLNYYLKKDNHEKICLVGYSDISLCKKNKYYIIDATINLYNENILSIKDDIMGGKIIYIHDVNESVLNVLIDTINRKNLKIVPLSELIKE